MEMSERRNQRAPGSNNSSLRNKKKNFQVGRDGLVSSCARGLQLQIPRHSGSSGIGYFYSFTNPLIKVKDALTSACLCVCELGQTIPIWCIRFSQFCYFICNRARYGYSIQTLGKKSMSFNLMSGGTHREDVRQCYIPATRYATPV